MRQGLATVFLRARATPYYAGRLAAIDCAHPALEDLSAVPVLRKEDVRRSAPAMLTVPVAEVDEVMTSGTCGAALSVYLDRDRSVREWAFVTHLWQRCGYHLKDRRAVLRGAFLPDVASRSWSWEPGTRELRLSPFRMIPAVMDDYLGLLHRYRIAWIHGYPSAIALLARHARNVGWRPPPALKGILPISESLQPGQRETMRDGFGPVTIAPFYGLTEKVAIAGEVAGCEGQYAFEPLYGITELVDEAGRGIEHPGEQGRLIGTGFLSTSMPLIRYDTGDLATLVEPPASENLWRLRVVDIVSGWQQSYLVTREGALITPTVLYPNNSLISEFRFVQDTPGEVVLRVVPEEGVGGGLLAGLLQSINAAADGLMTVRLEVVDVLPPTSRGKRRPVEQHLDLTRYSLGTGD
jgi:phenylacetate-CoA ligase